MKSLVAMIFGLGVGFVLGMIFAFTPWSAVMGHSEVTITNNSNVPLTTVTVRAGDYEHVMQRLDPGKSTSLTLTPETETTLTVSYLVNGQNVTIDGGAISSEGDDRTLTVLSDGHTAILAYGSANASIEAAPARIETQAPAPDSVYPEPYTSDSR